MNNKSKETLSLSQWTLSGCAFFSFSFLSCFPFLFSSLAVLNPLLNSSDNKYERWKLKPEKQWKQCGVFCDTENCPPLLPNFISCSPYVDRFAQIFVSHIDLGFLQYLACFICTNQSLLGVQNQIQVRKKSSSKLPCVNLSLVIKFIHSRRLSWAEISTDELHFQAVTGWNLY